MKYIGTIYGLNMMLDTDDESLVIGATEHLDEMCYALGEVRRLERENKILKLNNQKGFWSTLWNKQ